MVPQSRGSPNLGDFGTPKWESRDKKPPSLGHGESYVSVLFMVCSNTKGALAMH
jgi:hypothetical protein